MFPDDVAPDGLQVGEHGRQGAPGAPVYVQLAPADWPVHVVTVCGVDVQGLCDRGRTVQAST